MKKQTKTSSRTTTDNENHDLSMTGRDFMEQALRESEEKFFSAFQHSPALMSLSSFSTDRLIDVNDEFLRVLGYSRKEVIGKTPSYLNLFASPEQRNEIAQKLREHNRVQNVYVQAKNKSGKIIDLLWSGESIYIGNREYLISSAMDITERKQAENKLLESEARYRGIFENIQDVYYEVAFEGTILELSPSIAKYTPYQREQLIGLSVYNFYDFKQQRRKLLDVLFNRHKVTDYEIQMTDKNGGMVPCAVSSQLIFDADGKPLKIIGTLRSIEERKKMEETLRASERRFKTAFYTSPDAININRLEDGLYMDVNEGFTRLTGYTREDVLGKTSGEINIWRNPADRKELIRGLKEKGYYENLEADFRCKDGSITTALMSARMIELQGEMHILSITRDISDRKKLEAQLIQSQKMEAIGTLAGGIAHDFNNILGAIIGYAEMAQDEIPAGNGSLECIEQILKAGERAKYLVSQILAFSRHAKMEKKLLMIVPLIKEVVKLLRHALPATIAITEDLHVRDGFILADPTQIHQVLMNLCTNAGHAMRERGGTLTISLKQAVLSSDRIGGHDALKAGSYLELKVADTGHGIDPSFIDHIFEPFFTTKKQGEGTGMGLSIVYGIIKSCDGSIRVESQPGVQTIFTIYLPQQQPAILTAKDPAPLQKAGGKEKILLVEDRDDMLRMMHNMLTRLGYGVTARQNPQDAVVLFKSNPAAFDMIITDQTMPHLTGADMAKEALSIRPDIPIILCTGFSDLVSREEARAMGIREYMAKPIVTRELAQTIRNIFDQKKTEWGEDLGPDGQRSDN